MDGNFIREWNELKEIQSELKISAKRINEVLNGRKKSSNNFRWSYEKKDNLPDYYDRHIFQYDIYGNFIKEWKTVKEIIESNSDITRANILSALEGKSKTCKNYQWSYQKVDNIGEVNLYKRKSTVYVYTNKITNQKYVGQTRSNVKSRAGKNGEGYKQSTKFYNAIK